MHHLRGVTLIEVPLLSGGVVGATGLGLLIPAPCRTHRIASRRLRAIIVAVSVSVVAPRAQEEHLATSPAHHKP